MRSGQKAPERPQEPAPIVLTLYAWSRRLIAIFLAVAIFFMGWSFAGLRFDGRNIALETYSLWQVGLVIASFIVVGLTVFLRRLARHIEWELRYYGSLDVLTGLSNRSGLMDRLQRPQIAVLYLDLDKFKSINDSLGHDSGDEVIKAVAQRIRRIIRPEDLAARLGGDEFVIVIEDPEAESAARALGDRIRTSLAMPMKADRREVCVTASIGIAVKSAEVSTPSDLLRAADLALYRAKRQGRDRVVFFNESTESNVMFRMDLEKDLWKAMDRGELELDYLPEVNIQTGVIGGVEALVRWRHPDHGVLRPNSFLTLAEETGSVTEIGIWALETACRDWRAWRDATGRDINLGVNLSPRQLTNPELVRRVEEILLATGMDPTRLRVEISDKVLLDGGPAQAARLQDLHSLGIDIVIDDFGTGHAPLNYLRQWPVQAVKIDRSLVSNLEFDDSKMLIVQAIISLAHDLGIGITAVGIETPKQLSQLFDLGCDFGQGYYLSEPVPARSVEDLLAGRAPRGDRRPPLRAA